MTLINVARIFTRWLLRGIILLAFAAGVVLLMLYLAGKFEPKVAMTAPVNPAAAAALDGQIVVVRTLRIPSVESAVGTIRAVHETSIGSKLLARVVAIDLKAGQKVKADEVLVRLDDSDLRAKLQQAKAAVDSLEAVRAQNAADEKRYASLIKTNAISQQDYEKAVTALHASEADLIRARETVNEVQATLEWTVIRSPIDGTVYDKKVDIGDMVSPGQILVTLFDQKRMQLVASVRESLTRQLRVGQNVGVQIEGLNKQCTGTISEIVPEAQAATRAFQVKVTGPCPAGIYSGMFGRIQVSLDDEQVTVIPQAAVRRVGQLELVRVVENDRSATRAIRTGRSLGDDVEVLSGLREGERIVVPAAAGNAQEAHHG